MSIEHEVDRRVSDARQCPEHLINVKVGDWCVCCNRYVTAENLYAECDPKQPAQKIA